MLNLEDSTNPILNSMAHYSPLRFSTEWFMRQIMDSNSIEGIDEYCESYGYKFKMDDFPYLSSTATMCFMFSWFLLWKYTKK